MKELILNTKPKYIKDTKISTLEFMLIFPIELTNDTHLYISLLRELLLTSNAEFPKEDEFYREKLRKNIVRMQLKSISTADKKYLCYQISLPKEKLIKDYNLEESFKFAIYTIYNPDIKDGGFDEYKFNREKKALYEDIKRSTDGINAHNNNIFFDIIDPFDELGNTQEENLNVLENIDRKKLYKFYKENILENQPITYFYGNASKATIENLFNKYVPCTKELVKFNINYFQPLTISDHKYQVINTEYSQSEILYEYQVDLSEEERQKLSIIFNILNASENNLIFKKVRIENNLVYDIFLTPYLNRAMFIIGAFVSPNNLDTLKKLIDDVFIELHDKKYMTDCYNRLIKAMEIDLLYEDDNNYNRLNKKIYADFDLKTTEDIIEEYKNITVDELIEFLDRIKLTNVVFFKGGENHES